jgi:hypothetical protein
MAVFAALLAVFLQAFVVQTHVHPSGAPTVAAHEQTVRSANSGVRTTAADEQANAPICGVLITSCHTTLTTDRAVPADAFASNETAAVQIRRAPRAITHSWQSRAPPIAV